jgi:hypothetical protein
MPGGQWLWGLCLPAGRTVSGATAETGAAALCVGAAAPSAVHRGRCPADKQPQGLVVWSLLVTLGQRVGVERAKHRATGRIDHRDDGLRPARRIEYQPGVIPGNAYEITDCDGLHRSSLPTKLLLIVAHSRLSTISVARDHWSGGTMT